MPDDVCTPLTSDLITFEIVRGGLSGIAEEMKNVVMRGSFSPLLSLSGDLSCAVADRNGNVVVQGEDIPVHLGAMPFTLRGLVADPRMTPLVPGDVLITNDPYAGGNHLPDVTVVTPVFHEAELIAFCASRVHWPDVGGSKPGSSGSVDDILKEGVRIPATKLVRAGTLNEDLIAVLLANMRLPEDRRGDLEAQMAGNRRGCARLLELADRYGRTVIAQVLADTQAYSESLVRQGLTELPDGTFAHAETLDGDGFGVEPSDLVIQVRITKRGGEIHCDFTGTSPCARGSVNAPESVTASSTYYSVLALLGGRIPPNSGAYRAIRITAPPGTLVHATPPHPVVAANTETASRIVDVVLGALTHAAPDRIAAGSYGSAGVYTLSGVDPRSGRTFVHYETVGGGMGATCHGAAPSGMRVHMGNTMNLPVEAIESRAPVLVRRYELIPASGGTGRQSGGAGARKVIESTTDRLEFAVLGERTDVPAAGHAGGGAGGRARFGLRSRDGTRTELPSKTSSPPYLGPGDQLWIETAGGGGYGAEEDTND
jgi:N-methylhydantoinase B